MGRIQGVPARICTWELVTGFGQNPTEESLMEFFYRDFPEVEKAPKFWKMVSFNSSEGRHHRYLVILADRENQRGGRDPRGRGESLRPGDRRNDTGDLAADAGRAGSHD